MQRIIITIILAACGLLCPAVASALNFEALAYTLKEKECHPIAWIGVSLPKQESKDMACAEGAMASIVCDVTVIKEWPVEIGYYEPQFESEYEFPYLHVEFDEPLTLQKGKHYSFIVPAGTLYSLADPTQKSPEYGCVFEVPDVLPYHEGDMDERVASEHNFNFFFSSAIEPLEGCKGLLYREDVLVGEYTLDISSDWDAK